MKLELKNGNYIRSIILGQLVETFMVIQPSDHTCRGSAHTYARERAPFISSAVPQHLCYLYRSSHLTRQQCVGSHYDLSNVRLVGLVHDWNVTVRQTLQSQRAACISSWFSIISICKGRNTNSKSSDVTAQTGCFSSCVACVITQKNYRAIIQTG